MAAAVLSGKVNAGVGLNGDRGGGKGAGLGDVEAFACTIVGISLVWSSPILDVIETMSGEVCFASRGDWRGDLRRSSSAPGES